MNSDGANTNNRNDDSPPRQRARPGDQADPAVERAFDYLLHTLFHARTEPNAMAPEHEEIDISDMPPLEPLSTPATTAPTTYDSYSHPSGASLTLPSSSMDIDSSSHPHIQGSLGMQFIQQSPATGSTAPGPSTGRNRRYVSGRATGRTRTRANNDTDNDMPDLLDVSDSDEDADADDVEMLIRDSNTSGSSGSVNMEEQIVQDLADMPALEQANHPRRTTVEDDAEGTLTSSVGRVPPTSANPDAVRTGSRRTRAEVDDADNDEAGPDTSPSTSVYVTPSSTPTQTPSRAGTPAGGPAPANHPDRLLRPLPRNGPPPLRTTATPVNMNALFGAPGFATAGLGQAFDANTLLRQFFHGITGLQNVAQTATQTNGNANANANANANQGQAPPPPPPPPGPQSQPATGDATTPNTEAQTHANADRVNAEREAFPSEDVRMGVHFIDDGEDLPMADGFPFGGVFDLAALHERRQNPTGPPRAPEQDGAPRANPNAGAAGAGAGTEGTEMNMFFEMMRALMGGDAAGNFGDFSALFGDYNREDPERARRLVAGMEAVPEGLIKRMECVGGAPGAHEDVSGGAGGEEAQCAVCWDSLLNAEGDSFESVSQPKKEEAAAEGSQEAPAASPTPASEAAVNQIPSRADGAPAPTPEVIDAAGVSASVPPIAEPPTLASEPGIAVEEATETKKEQEVKEEKEKEKDLPPLPKVVSLPCAHVFHASCLLPWFSRPGQTTCPVCRFNIDPENLTYRPPQQQQQGMHRMPGMHTPTGMDTGAHWTIHAGEGILPPWAIMHGANRPDVTPAAANANMRPGIAHVTRPAGAAPLRAQPRETGPTQAGAANNATRAPRVQGPTQPVFPFPPFQHGPHVHPNIHPHLLHQRFQADQRHHGPRSQAQAPFQPGPHFHPNIHRRGTQVGQQQQTSAPQPQAQPQTQPGPHFHPNIHPDFLHQRVHGRQQPQQQQQQQPPPPQQQQQQRHRTTIVAHGVFNPDEPGDMLTMNFDLFFAPPFSDPNDPLGHQQHDHVHAQGHDHSMPNADEAGGGGRPANPANAPGAASSGTADGAQQDARAGRQQANEERTFVEIFTRTIPFATEFGGVRPAGGVGMAGPGATPRSRSAPARPRERKEWTVPPPPGLTLRQRVEKREREADLRCDDVSCGLGPTDEDPLPRRSADTLKTIAIRRDGAVGESAEPVCIHHLHAACLVDAGRVAGWGAHDEGDAVEVSCPVCRAVGHVEHEEWEAGVTASEAVLA